MATVGGVVNAMVGGAVPSRRELSLLLAATGGDFEKLCSAAQGVRLRRVGPDVYLRGLIELGNCCRKDCYYCGIRRGNGRVCRYTISDDDALAAARFAHSHGYASLAIQSGEDTSPAFVSRIENLLHRIQESTKGALGITLSLGEQAPATYRRWRAAGAIRYLLRIETSSEELYAGLHPNDDLHSFSGRLAALRALRACGYHVGSGVMIGLPGQTLDDLANDLLWLRGVDVDMVGMGPYLAHPQTPLWARRNELWPLDVRLRVSIAMVAALRLLMPDINIAATTALQAVAPDGRERAVAVGANVLMPNITPRGRQDDYSLYDRKPLAADAESDSLPSLAARMAELGCQIATGNQGNSQHFTKRVEKASR